MNPEKLRIRSIAPQCGAEVLGVNLAERLDDESIDQLSQALAEHCVLFFRDQELTAADQKAFGKRFGELHQHPDWPWLVDGHPEIMEIRADENSTRIAGEQWHSDVSCDAEPPLGSILYMREKPPSGGDTLFANMHAAFDALSPEMQSNLMGLTAIHDGEHVYRQGYGQAPATDKTYPRSEHPIVRTHPVSGRQALFVNRTFTTHIPQLQAKESGEMLEMLFAHLEQPSFQCRFIWQPDSVAFWDNRCAQHQALWDYFPNRRTAWRVTIKGEAPYLSG